MKTITKDLITSVLITAFLAFVVCGIYPVAVWATSQVAFPHQANGSLIEGADRKIVGSEWLGQNFTSPQYFHSRPSAAGTGYDAVNSGGTNLGPTSQKLIESVRARVAAYRMENNLDAKTLVPADAVTSSASGLDPHISPRNALLQAPRVAKQRGLGLEVVKAQLARYTAGPQFGLLGDAGVNVLELNLALDALPPQP